MKKMSVRKEVLTIALMLVVIFAIGSKVFATGLSTGPIQINITETPSTSNVVTTEPANEITPTANIITPVANTTGSTYQNTTTLPQTGDASDYAIFMLIAVAGVIAVYAYKKVREYNI